MSEIAKGAIAKRAMAIYYKWDAEITRNLQKHAKQMTWDTWTRLFRTTIYAKRGTVGAIHYTAGQNPDGSCRLCDRHIKTCSVDLTTYIWPEEDSVWPDWDLSLIHI